MRGKLRDTALKKATENLTNLREVLPFCSQEQKYRDVCSASPDFWKYAIEKFLGNIVVLQRGDLQTGPEWYSFAQLLATGVRYEYALEQGQNVGEWADTPEPLAAIETSEQNPDLAAFDIPGVVPAEGTRAFFVHFGEHGVYDTQEACFFAYTEESSGQRLAIKWVAEEFHWRFKHRSTGGVTLWINANPEIHLDKLPAVDFFVETVTAAIVNGDFHGTWSLEYRDEHRHEQQTTYIWDIAPITF